jgi:hypothetical protein
VSHQFAYVCLICYIKRSQIAYEPDPDWSSKLMTDGLPTRFGWVLMASLMSIQ